MEGLNANERGVWSGWEGKSPREVVREAAAKGTHVYLAQRYLTHKMDWTEEIAQEFFQAEVFAWVLQLLQRKQIFKVKHVLGKVQTDPERHLLGLARQSRDIAFRDYLVQQLQPAPPTPPADWQHFLVHWHLLKHLENSFAADGTFKQNKVFGWRGELLVVTESEIKALTVEEIEKYPDSWKSTIAAHLFFHSFEWTLLELVKPPALWLHLLQHDKAMILVRWVNMHCSELVRDKNARYNFFNRDNFLQKLLRVDTAGPPPAVLDTLDAYFRSWPLTDEMVAAVPAAPCYRYTRMCVLDTLCSYGVLVPPENRHLPTVVSRLARTHNLTILDHIFQESCATISKRDFYIQVAKYCVKNKLYDVLSVCVDGDVIGSSLEEVEEEARGQIALWLQFQSIEQTSDRQSHVLPIYRTCEQLAGEHVDRYVARHPHLLLGTVLLDDHKRLFDVFAAERSLRFDGFQLPSHLCEEKLPHTVSVYQKYLRAAKLSAENDVDVYQLLSGYRGLDVSKLFYFQLHASARIAGASGERDRRSLGSLLARDTPHRSCAMPHFADARSTERYGYVARLNHTYYLKQNRACSAARAFVRQQYQTHDRLQERGVQSACCEAHALALERWEEPAATASVIAFMGMVGWSAARCRVHASAAHMLHTHLVRHERLADRAARTQVHHYMGKLCREPDAVAPSLLRYLEEITLGEVACERGADAAALLFQWQTAVKFAAIQGLQYPERQLREFARKDLWFPFLLFGDVFRYPPHQMLALSREFRSAPYADHLKHIILHKTMEDISTSDKDTSKHLAKDGQRRVSRLSSLDNSPTHSGSSDFAEVGAVSACTEVWEALSACHLSEDPPGALVRAAGAERAPLLALVATCYEPAAVGLCWAYWVLSSLGEALAPPLRDSLHWDVSENFTEADLLQLTTLCVRMRRLRTLHESFLIFFSESALTMVTAFLCRALWQLRADEQATAMLRGFALRCRRRAGRGAAWLERSATLHTAALALVREAFAAGCLASAYHQVLFLQCLVDAHFARDFSGTCPDFEMLLSIMKISMEESCAIDVTRALEADGAAYLQACVEILVAEGRHDAAARLARASLLPVDDAVLARWSAERARLSTAADPAAFLARCSEAIRAEGVAFSRAVPFLTALADELTDPVHQFYAYRIVVSWFEESGEYGAGRERTERAMWDAYLARETDAPVFLHTHTATLRFLSSGERATSAGAALGYLLSEVEARAGVERLGTSVQLSGEGRVRRWRAALRRLLELELPAEAWRLAALYEADEADAGVGVVCPVRALRACLALAEGACSPHELPLDLQTVSSSPSTRWKLSEAAPGEEARAGALEALAARAGVPGARRAAALHRVALHVRRPYAELVRAAAAEPLRLLEHVSGRARMPLAALLFRTFDISSKEIAEYLCLEMVTAIISPHLLKTSTFRQKEHFEYTLWGFPLASDVEMFLNMRPDACSLAGRLLLDHLLAFRRLYRARADSALPADLGASLELDASTDDEYHALDDDELSAPSAADTDSLLSEASTVRARTRTSRTSRRNLFDVISNADIHIPYQAKANIRNITKGAKLSTKQVNVISIELLVLAHESFSMACDTEGIAVVLRSAQALTAHLLAARSWRLMVRLLTGLARYTEMAYVFQMLRENHQFEFLLGQFHYMLGDRQDKITEFKQGLLEYLRRHCAGDTDAYCMVALHFSMYAEAAHLKSEQAADIERALRDMALHAPPAPSLLHDNASTRLLLEAALQHSVDAAELYVRAGGAGAAHELAARAQLLALQLALLAARAPAPAPLLLHATHQQACTLVSAHLGFAEGLVLMSVREGGRAGAAWRELAYRRVLRHDRAYLRDLAAHRPDVARQLLLRYEAETNRTTASQAATAELCRLITM